MDLRLDAERVEVTARGFREVDVEVYDVDKSDVLEHFKLDDIIDHFGIDKVLDYIGVDEIKEYFHLTDKY